MTTHTFYTQGRIQILEAEKLLMEYQNRQILEEVDELILDDFNLFAVDLAKAEYLNSAGLNFLIGLLTKSRNAGGETVVVNINEQISKLLVMMKLKKVFTIFDSLEEGIEFLKKNAEEEQYYQLKEEE